MNFFTRWGFASALLMSAMFAPDRARADQHEQAVSIDVVSTVPVVVTYRSGVGFRTIPTTSAIDLGYARALTERIAVTGGVAWLLLGEGQGPAVLLRSSGRAYVWSYGALRGAYLEAGLRYPIGAGVQPGLLSILAGAGFSHVFDWSVPIYAGASLGATYDVYYSQLFPSAGAEIGVAF